MHGIYLIHIICNNYHRINCICIYYNWHTVNNYSILLIMTNNKKLLNITIISQVKENILLLKHWGFFLIHIRIESFICFQSIFIIFEVPLVQTWNKKQFFFDSEVCSSNENKSIWFGVPWGTITAAVTLVLSSPREWTNNYVIIFFSQLLLCCVVLNQSRKITPDLPIENWFSSKEVRLP